MRKLLGLAALVFVGVLAWRIGGMLSTDAIGMAVGLVFGVMAGIPAALLVLATDRRRQEQDEEEGAYDSTPYRQFPTYPQPPPVIVFTAPQAQPTAPGPYPATPQGYLPGPSSAAWPPPRAERQFRVVGEREEWIE